MPIRPISAAVLAALVPPLGAGAAPPPANEPPRVIVFGSDFDSHGSHATWEAAQAEEPDLLVLAGGMIDVVADNSEVLDSAYAKALGVAPIAELWRNAHVMGTWNEGEFSCPDCGTANPYKKIAKKEFLEFIGEAQGSNRWKRHGVFGARAFGRRGQFVQVILLDTQYFRDPPQRNPDPPSPALGRGGPYAASEDYAATVLGPLQWEWLEKELSKRAELRIVVSPMQAISAEHGEMSWAKYPRERQRLLDLLGESNGVVLVSGGRGFAEISRLEGSGGGAGGAGLVEVTVGGWNRMVPWQNEINRTHLGARYHGANYGVIEIDWSAPQPGVAISIRDDAGGTVIRHELELASAGAEPDAGD